MFSISVCTTFNPINFELEGKNVLFEKSCFVVFRTTNSQEYMICFFKRLKSSMGWKNCRYRDKKSEKIKRISGKIKIFLLNMWRLFFQCHFCYAELRLRLTVQLLHCLVCIVCGGYNITERYRALFRVLCTPLRSQCGRSLNVSNICDHF